MVLPEVSEVGGWGLEPVFSHGQLAAPTPPRGGLTDRRAVTLAVRCSRTGSFQAFDEVSGSWSRQPKADRPLELMRGKPRQRVRPPGA